ncbi:MAG: hypothetical protein DYG89_18385 [Caldilinea sp. CFX5]|nr:hypothetical protein [Caldilinea sp. CFX5]
MLAIDDLLPQLLGNDPYGLTPVFRQWLVASRRFRTFAESYQSKIRAKLRTAGDKDALHDLLFELTVARWLLQEKRFQLAYEQQPVRAAPGPDFTVTFTTKTSFHVEVTRIRTVSPVEHDATLPAELYANKLLQVILGKLMQVKTGATNLLLIGLASAVATEVNLDGLLKSVRQRIEGNDATLLARSRLRTPGEFFKHYHALSGILLYISEPPTAGAATATAPLLWLNKEAKYPLLPQVQTCLRQLPLME